MGLLDGIREWQFRRSEDNFWRQATPALREHLSPQASATRDRNARISAEHLRNGERETAAVCRDLSRATNPAQRAAAYARYTDQVTRNMQALGRKYGVGLERTAPFAPLRDIEQVCARRAGVPARGR